MKKILSVLISVLLIISCGACAKKEPNAVDVKDSATEAVSDSIKNETTTDNVGGESSENSDAVTENNSVPETHLATRIEAGADGFISPVEKKTEVPEDYIGIHNAQEFDSIRYNANANYILMNDIDLSEFETWKPIEILNGELDGNGYAVKGLSKIDAHYDSCYSFALFHKANTIKNLAVQETNISAVYNLDTDYGAKEVYIAPVATIVDNLSNCYSTGKITIDKINLNSANMHIGGLSSNSANADNCYSSCNITVGEIENYSLAVGGLFSSQNLLSFTTITNSYFDGKIDVVKNKETYIGGIIGASSNYDITINNCRSDAEINVSYVDGFTDTGVAKEANVFIGGIVGNSTFDFGKCYSNTNINANFGGEVNCYAGGIAGNSNSGQEIISECYNTGNIFVSSAGKVYCGGIAGYYGFGINWYKETANLSDCFNTGSIKASSTGEFASAGGICGYVSAQVINCYNVGVISGNKSGAIAGDHDVQYTKLLNCYYTNTDIGALGVNALFESVRMLNESEAKIEESYEGFSFVSNDGENGKWTLSANESYNYPTLANLYFEQ